MAEKSKPKWTWTLHADFEKREIHFTAVNDGKHMSGLVAGAAAAELIGLLTIVTNKMIAGYRDRDGETRRDN